MTTRQYPTAVKSANTVGSVTESERKIVSFDVSVDPKNIYGNDAAVSEFLLTVNGHTVRRMTYHQAERLGLVQKGNDW